MRRTLRLFLRLGAVVGLACVISPVATAQAVDKDKERMENERDLELRSWNLRLLQLEHNRARRQRPHPQQALAQLQEDFAQLQVANKSMLRAVLVNNTIEPGFISKSASAIHKRATRLNTNLALPEPEGNSQISTAELEAQQLKPSVVKLGRLIFSFIDNPFFKEVSVVDTQQTAKARRDLEDIIQLSELIKKNSERLRKTRH